MGSVLAGLSSLRAARTRPVLGGPAGRFARGHPLAAYPADLGVLPADRSGQRVAAAPAVVPEQRDGRSARRGLRAGRKERALPLPGQAARAHTAVGQPSVAELARPVL